MGCMAAEEHIARFVTGKTLGKRLASVRGIPAAACAGACEAALALEDLVEFRPRHLALEPEPPPPAFRLHRLRKRCEAKSVAMCGWSTCKPCDYTYLW